MNIKTFMQMCRDHKPKHIVEDNKIITNFECGCVSTASLDVKTFEDFLWYSCETCRVGHTVIDLSDFHQVIEPINKQCLSIPKTSNVRC